MKPHLTTYILTIAAAAYLLAPACSAAQSPSTVDRHGFPPAAAKLLKPRELWPVLNKEHVVPIEFTVNSDEIVASDTNPAIKLRKVTAHFWSQKIGGKRWGHPCIIFTPVDNSANLAPPRRGKVVIVGSPGETDFPLHVVNYGEPIAARTGYPTMVLSNPGEYADGSAVERDILMLGDLKRETGDFYYNMNCQLAVVYIQAMNAFQQFLRLDDLRAVIGGHSKRGRSAPVAAAMDPRVASAIIIGNEGAYEYDTPQVTNLPFYHPFFQEQVHVPVFYLGATNEQGYKAFNITLVQSQLRTPMTVELIPNYVHATYSEIQYMDFLMWVSHIFDGRPISQITDVTHKRVGRQSIFRAKVTGNAKIGIVKTWFVFSNNPEWRDLMWHHLIMRPVGDHYEAVMGGRIPDGFMVEVRDIALGIPGYVSSVPQKLTDAPVVERFVPMPRRTRQSGR